MSDSTNNPGREAGQDIKRSADRLANDAQATAEDLGARARDEAWSQAERAKGGVANEVSGIADALRKAADDMREGSPQERTFAQIASGLADASETIRDRDLGQIANDVSDFARRNPVAFLGGAALAGFVATRFAKSSAATPRPVSGSSSSFGSSSALGSSSTSGTAPASRDGIPGPATTSVGTTPGTGAPATASPPAHATRIPGDD